jgi:hypothetical protein
MHQHTESTTRSTLHTTSAAGEDAWVDEDSMSEYSDEECHLRKRPKHHYVATNLVIGRNLTLADVISEEVGPAVIK